MLKSYSHDNLRKGRYVKATKRPFFSLLGSRGQALSVSDPSWAWTDADNLEPSGYAGKAIGADGDLVLTLAGQNSVTESSAPEADITLYGTEVWGNLTNPPEHMRPPFRKSIEQDEVRIYEATCAGR